MKKLVLATLIGSAVTLSACTVNPYTGEKQMSKGASGAMIGAAAGALIGIATSDSAKQRKERALKGAGIGAVAGGGVGVYMDVQEAKLKEKLASSGVSVVRDGDNIILNMPGAITFGSDQYMLLDSFVPVLDSVAEVLKEYKSTMIQIGGHTDSTGADQYNMLLSQQRAQSVANALGKFGVQQVRMDVVGFGRTQPVASNSTVSGRAQNRRVELILLPLTQ